jgi:hypothetical protein
MTSILASLDADLARRTPSKLSAAQYKIQRRWLDEGRVTQWEAVFGPVGGLTVTRPRPDTSYVTVLVPQLHPFSRGNVVSICDIAFELSRPWECTNPRVM